MNELPPQALISKSCEGDLEKYGDNFRGNGYTKSPDEALERYALMLNVVRDPAGPVSVLDFGCGLGHLLDYLKAHERYRSFTYTGLDLSAKYLDAARKRHPEATFLQMDVLQSDARLPEFDYVILNGVFNYRGEIAQDAMIEYWQRVIGVAFRHCRHGIAFNVMSKIVDWERDDLFHLPFDTLAQGVARLSRWFVIRHDYRAFEYTTYVYREPSRA